MNLDELRTVQTKERQKDSLQHLRDSFYEDVAAYIQELKDERQRAADAADDPFSDPDVSRLTDEIETAEEVVEAIYERRVGKVVKLSSFAAADMPVDEEGLTTQERDLFEDLVSRIEDNKERVLDILAGEGDVGPTGTNPSTPESAPPSAEPDRSTAEPDSAPPEPDRSAPEPEPPAPDGELSEADTPGDSDILAEAMGADDTGEPEGQDDPAVSDSDADADPSGSTHRQVPPDDPPTGAPDVSSADGADSPDATPGEATPPAEAGGAAADTERTTVRITQDVGQILGMDDREYELASEDVVTLPAANADALLQRDAAERLE